MHNNAEVMGRAIVREPAAFLIDQPLSNLNAKLRVSMPGEIRQLQRRLGTASIYVTHDQVEAMTLADRLVVLNGGRVEQVGPALEVYQRPASTFVSSFIGSPAMSLLRATADDGAVHVGACGLALTPSVRGPVILGLRPEDLRPAAPGMAGTLTLRADYVEELGAVRLVHGRVDGQPLVVSWAVTEPVTEELGLNLATGAAHFFSVEGGQRLE